MKDLVLLLPVVLILTSCGHSQYSSKSTLAPLAEQPPPLTPDRVAAVRFPETIKRYHSGRYLDPSNRRVMHEAHPIYRIEETSSWNFHPGSQELPPSPTTSSQGTTSLETANLRAELARQQAATDAVIRGGQNVADQLSRIGTSLKNTAEVAKQNRLLQADLAKAHRRIDSLEKRIAPPPERSLPEAKDWVESFSPEGP